MSSPFRVVTHFFTDMMLENSFSLHSEYAQEVKITVEDMLVVVNNN